MAYPSARDEKHVEKEVHEVRASPSFSLDDKHIDLQRTRTAQSNWSSYFVENAYPYEVDDRVDLVESQKSVDSTNTVTPAATKDPRDPLNYPRPLKIAAAGFLCWFGAMAAAAELILGAMLPVFVLVYADIDPNIIGQLGDIKFPPGTNVMEVLVMFTSAMPNAAPLWKVYLLGSLPILMIGVSNLIMIPMATAIGRRPVILICGILAVIGCVWSGNSASLDSHLLARCVQAIGAGTVESLIPFVISDLTYNHERNTWMSFVFATQGLIIVGLGFATPTIIIWPGWRWLYFITAISASFFLVGVFIFLPETRWHRSKDELNGIPRDERQFTTAPRTWGYNISVYRGPTAFRAGWQVFYDAITTLFYPQILFITLLNSAMIGAIFAAGFTAAEPLLVQPWAWPFNKITLCLVPVLVASVGTLLITGRVADIVSNWGARRRPGGKRAPEDQLLNMFLPAVSGIIGTLFFGLAGSHPYDYSCWVFLSGLGLMAFGFLGANTVGAVYVLEVYPQMSGSALLNIASIRYIIAFVLSFRIAEWIVELGYFGSFIIYTIPMCVFASLIPLLWYFGPAWKRRWPGKVSVL